MLIKKKKKKINEINKIEEKLLSENHIPIPNDLNKIRHLPAGKCS